MDARVILRDNFERILADKPEVLIFGEDSGQIGGVNQGLEGLQQKFSELRVSDTRQCGTILAMDIVSEESGYSMTSN